MPALSQVTFEFMNDRALREANYKNNRIMLFYVNGCGNNILVKNEGGINSKGTFVYRMRDLETIAEMKLKLQEHGFFILTDKREFEFLKEHPYHMLEYVREVEEFLKE